MSAPQLTDALARVEQRLLATESVEALHARDQPADAVAAGGASPVRELLDQQSNDGRWTDLGRTAEAVLLLHPLRSSAERVESALARALNWLREQQRAHGSFVDHCTPELHAASFCHHFAGGFFSPGPRSASLAGLSLRGAVLRHDQDARLALSAIALRAVLLLEPPNRDDLLQLQMLRRLISFLFQPDGDISNAAGLFVVAALLDAPRTGTDGEAVQLALNRLAGQQRADGSWHAADPFCAAEVLLLAVARGFDSPAVRAGLERTANLLVLTQQPSGAWATDAPPYQLLTGWRTLRHAAEQ